MFVDDEDEPVGLRGDDGARQRCGRLARREQLSSSRFSSRSGTGGASEIFSFFRATSSQHSSQLLASPGSSLLSQSRKSTFTQLAMIPTVHSSNRLGRWPSGHSSPRSLSSPFLFSPSATGENRRSLRALLSFLVSEFFSLFLVC